MAGPLNPMRRPRQRLASINNPSTLSNIPARPSPTPPPPPPPPPPPKRPAYTCCDSPDVGEDDGRIVCFHCATVHELANIVSEITFGENAAGGATVQGGTVRHDQRHAINTMGGVAAGINGMDSRQTTVARGHSSILGMCASLNLSEAIQTMAKRWYQLALNHGFVQGRGIMKVAAVTIYLAARKQPGNTLLLMDLAENMRANVWSLGTTYREFCQILMEKDPEEFDGGTTILQIEPLMLKFCQKLEFGQDSFKVAQDACLILKRMSRDWMVQGRNPAGLCGACIILAARMNNFRRTVREVVYVVKVADTTINQRLYEYRRTESSTLTVAQFRKIGHRLKTKIAPPAVYRRQEREERAAGRKRKADALENGEDEFSGEEDDAGEGSSQSRPSKPNKRQTRMRKKQTASGGEAVAAPTEAESSDHANGESAEDMVVDVDALAGDDVDAGLDALANAGNAAEGDEEDIIMPKRRGRPHKKREPIVIPDEELEVERDLEVQMEEAVKDWEKIFKTFQNDPNHKTYLDAFNKARDLVSGLPASKVSNEEEIGEDEFADDPDVRNAKLSPEEVRTREKIWTKENEDWLREQQAKILAKALEEAQGKPKKQKQKRRRVQMGDGSVLEGQPAASAAEAAKKMIQKRAKQWSSHINYDVLKEIMPGASSSSSGLTTPAEQAASPAPEQAPASTYQTVPVGEGDEEPEEEEHEEQYAEEEEDLEQQYLSDDDEGFDENENYDF